MTYLFYLALLFSYLLFTRLPGPLLPDPLLFCSLLSVLFSPLLLPIRSSENAQNVTLIPPGTGLPSLAQHPGRADGALPSGDREAPCTRYSRVSLSSLSPSGDSEGRAGGLPVLPALFLLGCSSGHPDMGVRSGEAFVPPSFPRNEYSSGLHTPG